ncbi:MAG: L-histidine N(alpha)-methyltransferase [Nanoarchaeota archaeon]
MSQVNDLIFKEIMRRGYSLDGKTRVWNIADSKLWYLTPEQAQAYLDLVSTEAYKKKVGPKELGLIQDNVSDVLKQVGSTALNLVDLGCGNGKKAAFFLEEMQKLNMKVRYCPIDISSHMVKKAIEEVSALKDTEIIKVHWNISDFENLQNVVPLLRKDEFKTNFFLLLGNTLGNFEMHELLYSIRNAMRDGDILLVGNGLNNHRMDEDIVKSCRENPLRDIFFSMILKQIGFKKEQIQYNVRFCNDRLETYYTILKDVKISFQEKHIYFSAGDQIILGIAYHYKHDEYLGYLKLYFGEVELFVSKDKSYSLAICKK